MTDSPGAIEIRGDGRTVWVNSSVALGRFSRMGIDVHHDEEGQVKNGQVCIDCKRGPCTLADWEQFKASMWKSHGVVVDDKYMPKYLKKERSQ